MGEDDQREVRNAFEAFLQASSSNLLNIQNAQNARLDLSHSQTITAIPSVNADFIISGELLAGQCINGRMSNVRRSFCLLVTFDLLFVSLLWLICIMSNGQNIMKALNEQVYHYNVHSSLFDMVMCAVCRFVVLITFYALLYIDHWIMIALSTAASCAFLIGKVFVYDWSSSNHPTFEVPLVLFSFVISWGEAWFLDSRVLPQESNARRFIITNADTERAPLIRSYVNGLPSTCTDSVRDFYSPLASPEGSIFRGQSGPSLPHLPPCLTAEEEEQYKIQAISALQTAWDIAGRKDWHFKRASVEENVYYAKVPIFGKVYKLETHIDVSPRYLLDELFYKVDSMTEWNPALVVSNKLHTLDEHTDITYQVSSGAVGGLISCRDFVTLRHWEKVEDAFVLAWQPSDHAYAEKNDRYVRGKNVIGCFIMYPVANNPDRCLMKWILCIDLGKWFPPYVLEPGTISMMFEYIKALRIHINQMKTMQYPMLSCSETGYRNVKEHPRTSRSQKGHLLLLDYTLAASFNYSNENQH